MSAKELRRKIDRLIERIERAEPTELPVIKCYWGGEEIPDEGKPGVVVIRTEWGSTRLGDDEER